MKSIFNFLLVAAFCFVSTSTVFAAGKTSQKMRGIDLVGMQIIDSEGGNTFPYQIKLLENIENVIDPLTELLPEGEEIVSRIYDLDEESSFKNIYVFVAQRMKPLKGEAKYELYVVMQSKNSTFALDYDIVGISENELQLENGPSDEIENYTLTTGRPLFGTGPY